MRWVCFCVFAVVKFVCISGRLAPQQQAFFGRGGIFLASPTFCVVQVARRPELDGASRMLHDHIYTHTHTKYTHNTQTMVKRKAAEPVQAPAKGKGIVHSFKSKTNSSKRTAFAMEVINDMVRRSTTNKNDNTRKGLKHVLFADKTKTEKFASQILGGENDGNKIFFSAKKDSADNIDLGENRVWVNVLNNESIELVDTKEGMVHFDKVTNDPVFVLLNRDNSLGCSKPHLFVKALKEVEKSKPEKSTVRGAKREVRYEAGTTGANYLTTGVAAKRAGRGLYTKDMRSSKTEKAIKKMTNFIRHKSETYIDQTIKKALRAILQKFDLDTDDIMLLKEQKNDEDVQKDDEDDFKEKKPQKKTKMTCYFPSMATGRNACLEIHTDEDCFFSVVVVYCEDDIEVQEVLKEKQEESKQPHYHVFSSVKHDLEILKYFTFSTGVSVGLRSGDILLFNPLIEHCISSNTDACKEKDVYCSSFYFKSMVLGLNDNTIPFEEEQKK